MKILVINSGGFSLKFQVIDSEIEKVLAKGLYEWIGTDGRFTYRTDTGTFLKEQTVMENHTQAVYVILDTLIDPEQGVISRFRETDVVGHRLVHGGEKFTGSVVIAQEVIQVMTECNSLVLLRNPTNLVRVEICHALVPDILMVGVPDMTSNQTMEPKTFLYGLPYQYYEEYKIRRYGPHSISHQYVSCRTVQFMGQDPGRVKTIVCHLGNGTSICVVKYGQVVNNSMGPTSLEGLAMKTRYGGVNLNALEFFSKREGLDFQQIMTIPSRESGVPGISKSFSSDLRELKDAGIRYYEKATLAREIFVYKVAKYVGSYTAAVNGVGNIAFAAGIGEGDSNIREEICSYLEYLGVATDGPKNREEGEVVGIPDASSKVNVPVIKTNKELEIAREAIAVAEGLKRRSEKTGKGS